MRPLNLVDFLFYHRDVRYANAIEFVSEKDENWQKKLRNSKRVNDEVTHFEVRGLKSELGSKGQDTG